MKGSQNPHQTPASDNVFIGDLPVGLTEQDCQTIFAGYGSIAQCRVNAPKGGAKCSALIRFGSTEEAQWGVENLNGALPEGLTEPVVVRFANAPGTNNGGKDGGKGFKQGGGDSWG